jgi:hypothetical protein
MQRSKFAAKREKGQVSLFSFGIGQLEVDGKVPIPETQSKGEREEEKDSLESETLLNTGPSVMGYRRTHTPLTESVFFFGTISILTSKVLKRMDKKGVAQYNRHQKNSNMGRSIFKLDFFI